MAVSSYMSVTATSKEGPQEPRPSESLEENRAGDPADSSRRSDGTMGGGSPTRTASNPTSNRILGLDLARALALIGMVLVNFELALGAYGKGPEWLAMAVHALQGKAAATFVVLAGIGASLGSRRARLGMHGDHTTAQAQRTMRRKARFQLLRRGLFLVAIGTPFLAIWEADILHYYGVWLMIGSAFLFAPQGWLIGAVLGLLVGNAAFLVQGEFFRHWNVLTLEYQGLWEPARFARNLFLNGWHPVVPWLALYLIGMIVGRWDLANPLLRRRILWVCLPLAIALHVIEDLWVPEILFAIQPIHWLSTDALPPTPAFVVAGSCVALVVIVLACALAERMPRWWLLPFVYTGQLALTLYVGHVIVGLGTLEELGRLEDQSLPFAVSAALAFVAGSILFATLWRRRFARGPLEWVMRRLT